MIRLQPETALAEVALSPRHVQAVIDLLPDQIVVLERSGQIVAVNRTFAQSIGIPADRLSGTGIFDLLQSPIERAEAYLRRCAGSGQRLPGALTFRSAKGMGLPFRCDGAAMRRSDPGAPGLILLQCRPKQEATSQFTLLNKKVASLSREILARRQAEAALHESERRIRELLDALPAAVYTTDAAGRITYYNQAAVQFAGRQPMLGTDEWCVTWRLYRPDGTPMRHDECPMAVALKENRPIRGAEAIAERPDGTRIPFLPYPTPLRDASGALVGAVNMLVDITERKRAEFVTECQKQALQMLAEGAPLDDVLGFLVRTAERHAAGGILGSILLLNEAGTHFSRGIGPSLPTAFNAAVEGIAVDSLIGGCCHAVSRRMPVIVPDFSAEPQWAEFAQFVAPYGLRAGWSTPIFGSSGKVLGTFANYYREPCDPTPRDREWVEIITRTAAIAIERAQAEAALRELNASLEARVEERSRALETEIAERRKAEAALHNAQRLEAIGQLTGGVAHDFNNLLTVVVGHTDGIVAVAEGNRQILRMASAIQHAAERGARLVSQLLAFARRQRLRPAAVTIDRLLANIDDLVRRAVGETIEVEFDARPTLWQILVDPSQFESALLNLAVNARDAMPSGGRLVISARNAIVAGPEAARLDLTPDDYIVVSVADTGTGMPPDVRERAFEPFFTTKDVGKGTGLGLAQIYGFAKQSGGSAIIESTMGQGTTVSLYLPRAEAPVIEEAPSSSEQNSVDGHGKVVLVVEDQPEVREVIEMALTDQGYRTLAAVDGVSARKLLENNERIDLLLTDVVMPKGVSGIELARQARRLRPDLKILLVSGFPRDLDGSAGNIPEEFAFLEKPFRLQELAAAVASMFSEAKAAE
jgi:PAS domain S-box-containing protein